MILAFVLLFAVSPDETAVRAAHEGYMKALNALDLDAMSAYFADDITAFVPLAQADRVQGKAAVVRIFRNFVDRVKPSTPNLNIVPEDVEVVVSGDLALVSFNVREPAATRRRTTVFARYGDRWLIRHFHASDFITPPPSGVQAFNQALIDATKRMDNAAVLALWENDGVSLLPSTPPIVGKTAITQFLNDVTSRMGPAHMTSFTMTCADPIISGDWASEWCNEHQVVAFDDAKRPPFDGQGKMLFVLHRGGDGAWRIRSEMWNQGQ